MQICIRCKEEKELSEFYSANNMNAGVSGKCKSCCRIATIWHNIKSRCYDKTYKDFPNYGARGIIVEAEFLDYDFFFNWYTKNNPNRLQIDRRDNDKNYCVDNCHFVTSAQNCRNRRSTKMNEGILKRIDSLVVSGKRLFEVSNIVGIDRTTISSALKGDSWKDFKWSKEIEDKYRN